MYIVQYTMAAFLNITTAFKNIRFQLDSVLETLEGLGQETGSVH